MAQQQTHYSSADATTFKYYGESYVVGWNFRKRLAAGQTISSGEVIAKDVNGEVVTSDIVESVSVSSPFVYARLKASGGTVGQLYYLTFRGNTQDDVVEQTLELEIR